MKSYAPETRDRISAPPHLPDRLWLAQCFDALLNRLDALETSLSGLEDAIASTTVDRGAPERRFYSPAEFGELVGRSEYTVREWCRLRRINAEKAETGRGDAKNWKIPAAEVSRYRDDGLLPLIYLR